MLFITKVEIGVYPYMDDYYSFNKNFTVEAEDEKEVREKIRNHYKGDNVGGDNYVVNDIEIFEHIK